MGEGSIPYTKPGKKIAGNSKTSLFNQVRDFIEANQTYLIILLTIATILLTAVQIVQPLQQQVPQNPPKENVEKGK